MVRGLVPSMVRCKGWAILSWWKDWFLPCQMWVLSHSDVTVGLVPTWSDISTECHSWNGGTWSVTRKSQSRTEGHSDVTIGLVPTWSDVSAELFWHWLLDVSAEPFQHEGLVPCMVEYKCWAFLTWLSDVSAEPFSMEDWFLTWSNVSAEPFWHWLSDVSVGPFWQGCGMCSHMVKCDCWACLSDMIIGLVPTWSDVSVGPFC